ncbi:isopenicillin N synthase family dioxygenase [Lichenicoccus sp.]|uniref:isopenicillin N synthase family dioxygenase n=1 Tax=Lichenicoccus sp. TaxID=2781899 RepID=UPI003D13ED55
MQRVPTLDLRRLDADRGSMVAELGEAYRRFGFCCFSHHGIDGALVEVAYNETRQFFALPEAAKQRYAAGNRGYVGCKVETARTSDIPDLKEFFHVGRDENVWPAEIPAFRDQALALYASLEQAGSLVLSAIAEDLGEDADFFAGLTDHGNSILRALHYPPVQTSDLPAVRAEAHEDISLITLLVGATEPGLQVLTREGVWLPIDTAPDSLVVNVGDMLQRLTNRVYPSTTHRVVNPRTEAAHVSRYSMPFFLALNMEYEIRALPGCVASEGVNHYPEPITAHDYLAQRLREIRLG